MTPTNVSFLSTLMTKLRAQFTEGILGTAAEQTKRISGDTAIAAALGYVFFTGQYKDLPAPVQLVLLKVILVSMGFLHAHIIGKLVFPKVDWENTFCPSTVIRIAMYLVFVYAYALGG